MSEVTRYVVLYAGGIAPVSSGPGDYVSVSDFGTLKAENEQARQYLGRLLQSRYPNIELLPSLLGVCTQIDNGLAVPLKQSEQAEAALVAFREKAIAECIEIDVLGDGSDCAEAIRKLQLPDSAERIQLVSHLIAQTDLVLQAFNGPEADEDDLETRLIELAAIRRSLNESKAVRGLGDEQEKTQ